MDSEPNLTAFAALVNALIGRPAYILYLPREILDKIINKLSQRDYKSLRVTCTKLEEILNPIVFRRIHMSKARKDQLPFWEIKANPKITAHVCELVWYELAEDHRVFLETAHDHVGRYRHDGLRNAAQHDNTHTLPDLANMAASLFWLPSTPKHHDPQRDAIEASRTQILRHWIPHFREALYYMPKLDTFTSRPMPAHHILSGPSRSYQFTVTIREADLVGSVNRECNAWLVPLEERMVGFTVGTKNEGKEEPCICDWANPKFADVPDGMDYCALLGEKEEPAGGDGDDEDGDYQPSESTDTSESDSEFDQDSDFDMDYDSEQN